MLADISYHTPYPIDLLVGAEFVSMQFLSMCLSAERFWFRYKNIMKTLPFKTSQRKPCMYIQNVVSEHGFTSLKLGTF